MKKIFFAIVILISLNSYAQQVKLGFTSGLTVANYKSKVDGRNESGDAKAGFAAGVLADIAVGKHFSFQPALNFVQKGATDKQTFLGTTYKSSVTVNSIEIPINFLYNTNSRAGNVFIGAGPTFSLGVGGKYKYKDDVTSMSEKIKFGTGDEDFMKSFDMGVNFITGFTLKSGFMFSVNYNAGLSNLFPNGSSDGTLKSHYFGIKLGYLLKKGLK